MKKLVFLIFLLPVYGYAQKAYPNNPSKIAVLVRGGLTIPDHSDPQLMGTVSVQSLFKYGLSAGIGVGIERNDVLDMAAIPVFLDLTHVGDLNKVSPMISIHAGYLIGNRRVPIGNTAIVYNCGLLLRGLIGVKFPFKNGKFSFLQGGYGQQTITVNNKNSNYGEWVAVLGFKL